MVIAVKNRSDLLIENLKTILLQDYPLFEVIIVDDHSEMKEKEKLEETVFKLPQVFLHHSDRMPGKKHALSFGVEKANYGIILCTDADCKPIGSSWITNMINRSSGSNIVLGYSPYSFANGWLNRIIRFETVMTGIQYLSWAMIGKPYMGVGRNMLYPRSLFQKTEPYKNQQHLPYGDDDLWIQQASTSNEIFVCLDQTSHVISAPATSLHEWFHQKHRHMSAAHHYRMGKWWQPGLYGLMLIIHWTLLPVLLILNFNLWVILFFFVGFVFRWYHYSRWTRYLGDQDTNIWYPVHELVYAIYLAVMGVFTIMVKKKTWN